MSDAPGDEEESKPVMILIKGYETIVIDKWGSEPRVLPRSDKP